MGLADPHCHTTASDGMADPAELVAGALELGLDLIAVTDHDTMAAAEEVARLGRDAGLQVVKGQEITTRWPAQTHLLGLFLSEPVKGGMTLQDSVAAVHAQGGLAVIPHPFMPTYFASCQPGMLARLIEAESLDGIELEHTAPTTGARRRALADFYNAHREGLGAALGASDSHFGRHDLGAVVTEFEGRTAEDFRRALLERRTRPRVCRPRRVPAALAARQQWRSLVRLPLRRLTRQLE